MKTAEEYWEQEESKLIDVVGMKSAKEQKAYFVDEMCKFAERYASQLKRCGNCEQCYQEADGWWMCGKRHKETKQSATCKDWELVK